MAVARTAAEPDAEADAPSGGSPPPDLLTLVQTGASFAGVGVTEVRITLSDGRVQRLQLPTSAAAVSPMKRAVAQVVDEMRVGDVLSYQRIADKAGFSNSGPLRDFVKEYADSTGRLVPHRQGWEKVK